jgi:hypothetical protein
MAQKSTKKTVAKKKTADAITPKNVQQVVDAIVEAAPKAVVRKSKQAQGDYVIALKVGDVEQIASGDSAMAAICALDFSLVPTKGLIKGILKITKGERTFEKMLLPRHLKLLSWGKEMPRIALSKNLELMLKCLND